MKRMWFLPVFLGLALLLAACSSDARSAVIAEHPEHSATSAGSDSLPAAGQEQDTRVPAPFLLAGTLLLEDSDQAIDPEAASELLPLWQAYRSLVNSDTASQVEVDALLDQIQDTMGEDRMVAIAEMDLQSQNTGELLQGLGLESRQGQGEAREGNFPGGGFGGQQGGPGGGGPPGAGEAEFDPAAIATARAERGFEGGTRDPGSSVLLEPVLKLLLSRAEEVESA